MKYGILLLTLFILSDSFSFVFAQSMYDFKGKSTNISPFRMGTYPDESMDTYSDKPMGRYRDKSSVRSKDYQKIKFPPANHKSKLNTYLNTHLFANENYADNIQDIDETGFLGVTH